MPGVCVPGGVLLGACVPRQHVCLGAYIPRGPYVQHMPPPVYRMTDACENITLPQTSFADSNKEERDGENGTVCLCHMALEFCSDFGG